MSDMIKAAPKIARGLLGLNPKPHQCSSQWGRWGLAEEFFSVSTPQILPFQLHMSWSDTWSSQERTSFWGPSISPAATNPWRGDDPSAGQFQWYKNGFFFSQQLARKVYIPYWSYLNRIDCVACAVLLPPIPSQSPTPSLKLKKFPHPPLSLQTLITIPTDAKYLQWEVPGPSARHSSSQSKCLHAHFRASFILRDVSSKNVSACHCQSKCQKLAFFHLREE